MDLDRRACDRARRSRDARFDGRFFIAVTTTRIYCRPICPARAPNDDHIIYLPSAAAAQRAGFRPCLRCRPEASPGTPAWSGTSGVVSRALRLISDGALDEHGVDHLADRLGVTARHLRRLFLKHLGATPLDVAQTRRVHFAKSLIDETSLPYTDVALAAGFRSVRRFNSEIRRTFTRSPTQLRKLARQIGAAAAGTYRFRLAYRPPYDWDALLAFLAARATPGVETVDAGRYRRTIQIDDSVGMIDVGHAPTRAALTLDVRISDPRLLLRVVERVRRIFDISADPTMIAAHLGADPLLSAPLTRHPGIRTPGAWDGFELAVRAILGQQVSVAAATTIAGRIASMFGSPITGDAGLTHLFPTAAQLATAAVERAGVMPSRAATIRALAGRVASGSIGFAPDLDRDAAMTALTAVPGIGAWTAEYVAMRALNDPDAFPSGDLILRRAAGDLTAPALTRRAEAWRPWRSYAVMLTWQDAVDRAQSQRRTAHATPHAVRRRRGAGRIVPVFAVGGAR